MKINIFTRIYIKVMFRKFGISIEWQLGRTFKKVVIRWRDSNGWMFRIEKW